MAQSPPGPIICKFSGITTMWEKAAGPPWSRVCRRARESVGGSGRRFAHGTRVKQDPFKESCLTIQGPCCCTVGLMAIVSNTKFLSSATIVKLNSRFDLLCSMVQFCDFLHSCGHCRFCKQFRACRRVAVFQCRVLWNQWPRHFYWETCCLAELRMFSSTLWHHAHGLDFCLQALQA